jgi:SAM-dependent methyltransferase
MPTWMVSAIRSRRMSVLDWGCALGDGTEILSTALLAETTGMDFAEEAIAKARETYPSCEFLCWDLASTPIERRWDVVFSSNTLEHFAKPWDMLGKLEPLARSALVILVPFREMQRHHEHSYTFLPENVPFAVGDMHLVWAKAIDASIEPAAMWNGQQLLLIYVANAFARHLSISLSDIAWVTEGGDAKERALEKERADAAALREELRAARDTIAELSAAAAAARAEAAASLNGWSVAHAAAVSLHESAARWRGRALALEASTSWRVTGPLRRVVEMLRPGEKGFVHPPVPELPPAPERAAADGTSGAVPQAAHLETQIEAIRARLTSGVRRGLTIVTCGFDFDITVNQRPINLAREAAASGHAVIFVAWEWAPDQPSELRNRLFEGDILQVGRFDFTGRPELFEGLVRAADEAIYILSVPSRDLIEASHHLRGAGCAIVYDIMDDWEEFAAAGQAPWFEPGAEQNAVLVADVVAAVSPPLAAKFASVRHDIAMVPNGFSPKLLGARPGLRMPPREGERLRAGYFGHLTESWFDWELIFAALDMAPDLEIEVIGYGEPDWVRARAAKQPRLNLLGKHPPSQLLRLSQGWHVAMIPFKTGKLAEAVDPIKIYEYLYFRLPVTATGILHVASYPATRVATDIAGFVTALRDLGRDSCGFDAAAVDAFLRTATWRSRYLDLLGRTQQQRPLADLFREAVW